jgi:hypothetical protein
MYVTVTQLSKILEVSTARIRQLLIAGRIKGAFKLGHMWGIPLVNGMPRVTSGRRGPKLGFAKLRPDAMTKIHINGSKIRENDKTGSRSPVITVKKGTTNTYCHEVIIYGSCRIVYEPDNHLKSGARVWIETYSKFDVIFRNYPPAPAAA